MSPPTRYRYNEFRIDLDAREIRRDGERVDVEAKVFDLIALLLANRERALSKRELNTALWGDRPVTDAALSQQLRKARRALGDDGDAQRVIRTVHGRGLRWVAPVESDEPASAPAALAPSAHDAGRSPVALAASASPARSRRGLAAIVIAVVLALFAVGALLRYPIRAAGEAGSAQRIAVLPVLDRTGESDLGWTRTGLMGLMSSLFEQQGGLDVVAAQNVQAVMGTQAEPDAATLQTLRRALGATHFIVTELRRLGPLYELDLRLVAAGAAERRETLHGISPAPLAADAVARVRRWLDLEPMAQADVAVGGIASPFIAEAYARGLDAQLHGDAASAGRYFSICLDHDPGLAWPRLGLAIAQAQSGQAAESLANTNQVAAAARERGDDEVLVRALRQLASLAFFRGDLDQAAAHLDEALAHLPADTHSLALTDLLVAYGSVEDERGHFDRSRAQFERALALARTNGNRRGEASVLLNLASLDNGAGDAAAAAESLRAGLDAARAAGDVALEGAALGNLGATEANQGRLLAAIALFKQAITLARARGDLNQQMLATSQLIWTLAPFERSEDAALLANQMLAIAQREQNPYWEAEARWALAGLAARRHDWAQALTAFEQARTLYTAADINRSVAQVLADTIETAASAGDSVRAGAAADAYRALAQNGSDATVWRARWPLIDAQLRAVAGDPTGASHDLAQALDALHGTPGPAAQAMLFQLGRWQLDAGHGAELLARAEWKPWLQQHPDAIALRIAALRANGRGDEADREQQRLDQLLQAPELALDPSWLVAY
ncbi:MAG: winged helix-turn-helix domain-containing protein [Dokdonella sp.]